MQKSKLRTLALSAVLLLLPILLAGCADEGAGEGVGAGSGSGLTREEVQNIVRSEIAGPYRPPGPAPRREKETAEEPVLTQADLEAALQQMTPAVPATGITRAEVEQLIQAAVADLPQPQPGLTADEASRVAQYAVATVPLKTSPAAYTRFLVESAISRYEVDGLDATLAHYNRPESIEGQWYVFIVDEDDLVIAHPDGSLTGLDLKGPLGTDANGYNFGPEMLSATEDGKWVSYVYRNPESGGLGTGAFELKNVWVARHDGLLFASGWYINADDFTKSLVATAARVFREVGLEGTIAFFASPEIAFGGLASAIAYYNSAESVEGDWFAFVADESGTIVDHYRKDMIGKSLDDVLGTDKFEATAEGNWVTTEDTRVWVLSQDRMTFGSGWYQGEG